MKKKITTAKLSVTYLIKKQEQKLKEIVTNFE